MLLTLAATSVSSMLRPPRSGKPTLRLEDLPRYAREELGLYGLNLTTELLAGADGQTLDALRHSADRAGCPCLALVEPRPLPLGSDDDTEGEGAAARIERVVQAANRLGCSSAAFDIDAPDNENAFEFAAERLRGVLGKAERLEINVLVTAGKGLTEDPERLTDLIKRVGGFRIGTFPDFERASTSPDPLLFLRRLVPYAGAVSASSVSFKKSRKPPGFVHEPYDLVAYAEVVQSVGYQGTLAIDYRGKDSPEEGVVRTRRILESALELEPGT